MPRSYNPRWDAILMILQDHQSASVRDLSSRLDVSGVTIRKDLSLMEERGLLLRTHGGAVLAEDSLTLITFNDKSQQAHDEKEQIARKAVALVRDGMNLLIDSGTTCLALAQLLKGRHVQVITNSLSTAQMLSTSETVQMVLLGGTYRNVSKAVIGQCAIKQLRQYHVDLAFLGASGATAEQGFSCQNLLEAQTKQAMMQKTDCRVILMDSLKFGVNRFAAFASYKDVHYLVSDNGLKPAYRTELEGQNVKVL